MDLELKIYGKGDKVEKTYKTKDFVLKTGACEDIISLVDIDKLMTSDEKTLSAEVIKIVVKGFPKFKSAMQEIFDDLTDDEYKRTAVHDVAGIVLQVIKFTFKELLSIASKTK